jgi:hypothetical protein
MYPISTFPTPLPHHHSLCKALKDVHLQKEVTKRVVNFWFFVPIRCKLGLSYAITWPIEKNKKKGFMKSRVKFISFTPFSFHFQGRSSKRFIFLGP